MKKAYIFGSIICNILLLMCLSLCSFNSVFDILMVIVIVGALNILCYLLFAE